MDYVQVQGIIIFQSLATALNERHRETSEHHTKQQDSSIQRNFQKIIVPEVNFIVGDFVYVTYPISKEVTHVSSDTNLEV